MTQHNHAPIIEKGDRKTLLASTLGYAMDGLDIMILAFALILIKSEFGLTDAEGGMIQTITLIGTVIGGIFFGMLADKYGRVRVFNWTILLFSLFTGLAAISTSAEMFTTFRFIAGLGLGGEFGIGMTLVAETWPARKRSRATAVVAIGFQVGIVLAALVSLLSPYIGWHGMFLIGALPALLVWWTRRNLQEPEIWLQVKRENRNKISIKPLFKDTRTTFTTIGLIIASSVQNFGFHGIMIWMPTMLAKEHNFTLSGTFYWTLITTIGMVIGTLTFGAASDKFGRRPAYICFLLVSAAFVWIYFQQSNYYVLMFLGAILGFFVNGMMGGYGALLSEHYPTEARSSAQNIIFNLGRGIAGFAPVIIGTLAMTHNISSALGLISGVYLLSALAFIFLIPETKGKILD